MPARTVAALRLWASRWLRSCWITRWECCGWGEEDVLAPNSTPHGLCAGAALRWDPKAGVDQSEVLRPGATEVVPTYPGSCSLVPPPWSHASRAPSQGRPRFPELPWALPPPMGSKVNFENTVFLFIVPGSHVILIRATTGHRV